MKNPASESISNPTGPEKTDLTESISKELVTGKEDLLRKLSWQFKENRRSAGTTEVSQEQQEEQARGILRGYIMELVNSKQDLETAQTIFISKNHNEGLLPQGTRTVRIEEAFGNKTKEEVMKSVVDSALMARPQSRIIGQGATIEESLRIAYADLASKGDRERGIEPGIFFEDTSIPDGLVLNEKGEIIGYTESKAYTPEELRLLVDKMKEEKQRTQELPLTVRINGMNLGASLKRENEFVDVCREYGAGQERLDKGTLAVLRFPAPPELPKEEADKYKGDPRELRRAQQMYQLEYLKTLNEYGELLAEAGYNVVIQTLPLTVDELNVISKNYVAFSMERITTEEAISTGDPNARRRTPKFTPNEVEMLSHIGGVPLVERKNGNKGVVPRWVGNKAGIDSSGNMEQAAIFEPSTQTDAEADLRHRTQVPGVDRAKERPVIDLSAMEKEVQELIDGTGKYENNPAFQRLHNIAVDISSTIEKSYTGRREQARALLTNLTRPAEDDPENRHNQYTALELEVLDHFDEKIELPKDLSPEERNRRIAMVYLQVATKTLSENGVKNNGGARSPEEQQQLAEDIHMANLILITALRRMPETQ